MFSLFFIKRPVVAMVISIFIIIVGLISLKMLPIAVNGVHNIKEGCSSADAITAIEELAKQYLPKDIGYAFSGISLQEKEAGNAALYIFMLSLLMVYLFLSA